MPKKQSAPAVDNGSNVESILNLKTLLEDIGIQVSDEQVETLAAKVSVKKQPRKLVQYVQGQVKLDEKDKIPTQMRVALLNFEDGMTLNDWADRVALDKRFVTKQPVLAILAYYRKEMVDKGYIQPK